jgi:nucleoside-diphosphate-sugar epimerase
LRVLITGGAGFIGSNLARALVGAGHQVVLFDNLVTMQSTALVDDLLDRAEFIHGDVRCPEDLDRLPPGAWDAVYHLAASFANELSVAHPTLDLRTNVEGTVNVLAAIRRAGCGLFVYAGSSSSYGDGQVPFREDDTPRPLTPYATSKHTGESHVQASGLDYTIFRFFNVYGPGDPPGRYRNAIPNMFKSLDGANGRIRVFGAGATRDFTFVDDVVTILEDASRAAGTVVNVGTGVETNIEDLARRILRVSGMGSDRITVEPSRPWDRVLRRCADVHRLESLFGWVPATTLDEGLGRTARWLSSRGYIRAAVQDLDEAA